MGGKRGRKGKDKQSLSALLMSECRLCAYIWAGWCWGWGGNCSCLIKEKKAHILGLN